MLVLAKKGMMQIKLVKIKTAVVIPLKHLSNFWRSLNIPLINCEVELVLTWSKNCVLVDMTEREAKGNNSAIFAPAGLEFKIRDTKFMFQLLLCQNKMTQNF